MTKIIFVDDNPQTLNNLRSGLRAYRSDWTMEFCDGPESAFSAMAKEPFDVIVTDMRMPVMDGAELLAKVRDLYPNAARIVLSSNSEQEQVIQAAGIAHQYLSKPCDPEYLRCTITRVTLLGKHMSNVELKALVSRMDSLPSLPDLYYKLVEELQKDSASIDRVGGLISEDVSMTAKVLQLVNSSFFGLPVHINDPQYAAALLGLNTLKPLVLTASIFRQLEESRVSIVYLEKIFSHSLEVGGIAKALSKAEGLDRELVDNSFIGGALHDLGKVILADNFGREYTALCQQANAQGVPCSTLEKEEYGATHADVGGYLLGLWGLPQEIVESVVFHHEPDIGLDQSFSTLTAIYVANVLANQKPAAAALNSLESTLDQNYLERLGLVGRENAWQEIATEMFASV